MATRTASSDQGREEVITSAPTSISTDSGCVLGPGQSGTSWDRPPSPCYYERADVRRYDSTKPTTWTSFFRRIKNTIAAKGAIPDNQKKGIILEALDDATLDRLERWLEPISTEAASYNDILESLGFNIKSQVNLTVQYITFTGRKQQTGESALAYADAVSVLASTIGLADRAVRDELCMHQFVAGVQDTVLQERLLDILDPNLNTVVDMASQHKSTRQSAASVRGDSGNGVYRVSAGATARRGSGAPICYYCAGPHVATDCKEDRSKMFCAKCKGKGHVAEACRGGKKKALRKKGRQPETSCLVQDGSAQVGTSPVNSSQVPGSAAPATGTQRSGAARTTYGQLVVQDALAAPQPSLAELPLTPEPPAWESEGLFCINHPFSELDVPPQDIVFVGVQGSLLDFIVDKGAGRAMVSMPTYLDLPDRPPLHAIPKLFHGWDSSMVINMAGFCGVDVEYKGRRHRLPLLVANGDGPNLLGRNWFQALGFALVEVEGVNQVMDCNNILQMV